MRAGGPPSRGRGRDHELSCHRGRAGRASMRCFHADNPCDGRSPYRQDFSLSPQVQIVKTLARLSPALAGVHCGVLRSGNYGLCLPLPSVEEARPDLRLLWLNPFSLTPSGRSKPHQFRREASSNVPKRTDIHKILIIGAGPIVIGQACEFDYSGTQACKACGRRATRSCWSTPTRRRS